MNCLVFFPAGRHEKVMIDQLMIQPTARQRLLSDGRIKGGKRPSFAFANTGVQGIVRRSRSIQIEPDEISGKLFDTYSSHFRITVFLFS